MAEDEARARVHLLRRGKVVRVRVHEPARLEVLDREHNREVRVRGDRAKVRWADELRGGHRGRGRDHAHRGRVARPVLDLRAVREREVDRGAEVDEVV